MRSHLGARMARHVLVLALCVLALTTFPSSGLTQDAHPSSEAAESTACKLAEQLYSEGKFQQAAEKYTAALKVKSDFEPAQAGLARALKASGNTDEALKTITAAVNARPNSALLLHTLGDIQFRRGDMGEAEQAYRTALQIDPKDVGAYVGLAHLYRAFSLYGHAYAATKRAHELDPKDPEVQLLWLDTLPRAERLPAIKSYLAGPHAGTPSQRAELGEYVQYLEKTKDMPASCTPVIARERADIKLETVHELGPVDAPHIFGYGLEVKLNDHTQLLQLDTGASGILISRKTAQHARLQRISDISLGGIGDKGEKSGYLAIADRVKIGDLEFRNCLVTVSDKGIAEESDGLVGSDIFASYLVDIDIPQKLIRLAPLPQRPGDPQPVLTLDSDSGVENTPGYEALNGTGPAKPPQDRYVAPEMSGWTPFFRFGHMVLVPTRLNNSPPLLFLVDTGAFRNTISTKAARATAKVQVNTRLEVEGVSGKVEDVYRTENVTLGFGRFQQPNMNAVTIDLSHISDDVGTEISGMLGFDLLRILEIKIDYRDGLVDFLYRDRHGVTHSDGAGTVSR